MDIRAPSQKNKIKNVPLVFILSLFCTNFLDIMQVLFQCEPLDLSKEPNYSDPIDEACTPYLITVL